MLLAHVANVSWEALKHLVLLPDASLPGVLVTLALVTIVDLLRHINKLELQLDAVGWNRLVGVDFNEAGDRVIGVERAHVAFKVDLHFGSLKFRLLCSHCDKMVLVGDVRVCPVSAKISSARTKLNYDLQRI